MSKKLWKKTGTNLNSLVEQFTTGDDIVLDQKLIPFDIYGSMAHITMLSKIGVIDKSELADLKLEFKKILKKYKSGKYNLEFGDEDVHTKIENDISQILPESGAKIHTARSRNDQVLVDTRLFTKYHLLELIPELIKLTESFIEFAKKHEYVPMPGYTHMQRAMLSSVGLWSTNFVESLIDDLKLLKTAYEINDQSPLGSGACYGVSVGIDRQMVSNLLGFSKVQVNSLYCQNSRGKIEGAILHGFVQVMLTLGKFAQDVLLFTTSEYDFFNLPDELITGSSIMPQKRNVDVMELLRAKVKTMHVYQSQIINIVATLPSGYNRDLQEIKKPFFESFNLLKQSIEVTSLVINNLKINEEKMLKAIDKPMFAAHHAYQLVKNKKMPFRKAYQQVGGNLSNIPNYDPKEVLKQTNHIGAAGNLLITKLESEVLLSKNTWQVRRAGFLKKLSNLTK